MDARLMQLRLATGVGEPLARDLNALIEDAPSERARGVPADTGGGKVAIAQATASISQTSRERFADAEIMLQAALAAEPDNVDVQVALAALQMRGVQMVWYEPDEKAAAEASAKALLEGAVKATPRSIPVLQAYCRFLSATNQFAESLVACGRAVSLDPWDGSALYLIGLGQLNLGRFEDALATFEEAERYDTPAVSRWTWPLGAGWASLLLGRFEDAATDIERSITITPGSGRSHMLLAVAYHGAGRIEDAKAALAKGMELRPGTTLANFSVPMKNSSPRFVEQSKWIGEVLLGLGLPAG
jgi:tetratricopeptide (TPR) repeat protein